MRGNQRIFTSIGFLLFLVVCCLPLFLNLDSLGLRLWDESRRGVNALEMAEYGNWLVPHFMGSPDVWGTKPPMLVWFQAMFLKLIPSPEWAIRLPSALAGLCTALLLVWASKRILERPLVGCFAAIVLLTSNIYIEAHGAIAGDFDALLSLWLTGQVCCFFLFLKEKENRWLYACGLLLLLAGWTKGVAAFFFAPAMVLYALSSTENRKVFTNPKVYIVAISALLGILSYYLLRENLHPGYLSIVWENELGGRYLTAKEGHGWGFGYYFRLVHKYDLFFPWQYLIPLGFGLLLQDKKTRPFGQFLLILNIVFLLVVSNSATKLRWYVLPVIPLLSIVVGSALERLHQGLLLLVRQVKTESTARYFRLSTIMLSAFFVVAVFLFPYVNVIKKVTSLEFSGPEREKQIYRDFFRQLPPEQTFTAIVPSYNGHFSFYQKLFNEKGHQISALYLRQPEPDVQANAQAIAPLAIGTTIVFCETKARTYINQRYDYEVLHSWDSCQLMRITDNKPEN